MTMPKSVVRRSLVIPTESRAALGAEDHQREYQGRDNSPSLSRGSIPCHQPPIQAICMKGSRDDAHGQVRGLCSVLQDLSKRAQAEEM
jgi:hypothetical protein